MIRDYRYYRHKREVARARRAHDARDAALHARWDATKDEVRMKYERASFAVVGEGSRSAQDAYRAGWDRIFRSTEEAR